MKRFLAAMLATLAITSMGMMAGCKGDNGNETSINEFSYSSQVEADVLTKSAAERIALQNLYISLMGQVSSGRWNYDIDSSTCRYSVGSIKKVGSGYEVNGICYFYDKYGDRVTKYRDGSGGYSETFTINVSSSGRATVSWN